MAATPSFRTNKLAQLIALMATSLLNGAFAVLIGFVVWTLATNYHFLSVMHKTLFGASIFMFIISAASLGLVMQELSTDALPEANRQAQIIFALLQYVTSDLILIWRVWVVWDYKHLVIAGPLAILIVGAGFSFNLLHTTHPFYPVVPISLIVANTSLCTLLIAGRIWFMNNKVLRFEKKINNIVATHYKGIIFLVVESGALYASTMIVSLVLYFKASTALPIVLDLEIPLIGILPTLIIVLAHLDLNGRLNTSERETTSISFQRFNRDAGGPTYLTPPEDNIKLNSRTIPPLKSSSCA